MHSVIIHIMNEDAILGEIEELPAPTDTILQVKNPRKRDGKDLGYVDSDVTTVFWPLNRIMFLEVLPGEGDEEILTSVRE